MSFWKSKLIKGIEDGQLPTAKAKVEIDEKTIMNLFIAVVLAVVIIVLVLRLTQIA